MKAIKIDVVKKDVYFIEIDKKNSSIYEAIGNGCNIFECPVEFDNADTIYVDEEGLFRQNMQGYFLMKDWSYPLVGNGIILGTDSEGDSIDAKSDIEDIKSKIIKWGDSKEAEHYKELALNRKPIIYSF